MSVPKKSKIRPVGILKANRAKKAHIHKIIIEECGGCDIPYIINARSVLLYDPRLTAEELIASINVLKDSITLRRQLSQETVTTPIKIKE
uniref:Uncharacterized protein n=1 Tax=viral metagenome TaxID=1070528 RepID=A0A6M3M0F5_9ZZZZ